MKKYRRAALLLPFLLASCGAPESQPAPQFPELANCGSGLAATDLSGHCRANPPTMGALEAIDV